MGKITLSSSEKTIIANGTCISVFIVSFGFFPCRIFLNTHHFSSVSISEMMIVYRI